MAYSQFVFVPGSPENHIDEYVELRASKPSIVDFLTPVGVYDISETSHESEQDYEEDGVDESHFDEYIIITLYCIILHYVVILFV